MAWQFRVTAVTTQLQGVDDQGQPTTIDLSLQGRVLFTVEYFDSAAPTILLHTQSFDLQRPTPEDFLARAQAEGALIRDARLLQQRAQTGAQRLVGQVFDIP